MRLIRLSIFVILFSTICIVGFQIRAADNPFLGYWSLHLPGGGAGWLGVSGSGDTIKAEILWGGGSIFPLNSARIEDGKLVATKQHETSDKLPDGKPVMVTDTITATLDSDKLKLVMVTPQPDGGEKRAEFSGQRLPPMPPAPDLSKIKLGTPVQLFNGTNLDGWRIVEPDASSGWRVNQGILLNDITEVPGQAHRRFANLRTVAEFEDFSLHAETRLATNGNSGIYLAALSRCRFATPSANRRTRTTWVRFTAASSRRWRRKNLRANGRRSTSYLWTDTQRSP